MGLGCFVAGTLVLAQPEHCSEATVAIFEEAWWDDWRAWVIPATFVGVGIAGHRLLRRRRPDDEQDEALAQWSESDLHEGLDEEEDNLMPSTDPETDYAADCDAFYARVGEQALEAEPLNGRRPNSSVVRNDAILASAVNKAVDRLIEACAKK